MKKIIIIFLILSFSPALFGAGKMPDTVSGILDLLDKELAKRDSYVNIRNHRIDSLKNSIASDSLISEEAFVTLGEMTGKLNADSAVMVFSDGFYRAINNKDPKAAQRFLIGRVPALCRLNSTPEAMRDLALIESLGDFPENNKMYYEVARDLYYTMAEIFEGTAMHDNYIKPGLEFAKKYGAILDPDSYEAKLNAAMIFYAQGNDPMFIASLLEIVRDMPADTPVYSMALTALGGRFALLDRPEEAIPYLAKAAISEVRDGDRQGTALIRLGTALYELKDFARAHKYLSIALEQAIQGDAKTNSIMVSTALMPVSNELRSQERSRNFMLIGLIVSLGGGLLLLLRLYGGKKRRMRELENIKQQLAQANLAKEAYIADFMNLSSSFMESLEDFNRVCKRKITAGQTDDLLELIKNRKFIEEQRNKFDDIFDDSFLAIYPTFVEDVNKLLLPDKRIVPTGKNVLPTELRVLAFTRLGVEDTAMIARFLGVTLNTIYTYRNKLRNKAISRETFDSDVMKIGVIA